jgi:hypothetical protein
MRIAFPFQTGVMVGMGLRDSVIGLVGISSIRKIFHPRGTEGTEGGRSSKDWFSVRTLRALCASFEKLDRCAIIPYPPSKPSPARGEGFRTSSPSTGEDRGGGD